LITPDILFWKKSKTNAEQKAKKAGLKSSSTFSVQLNASIIGVLKNA